MVERHFFKHPVDYTHMKMHMPVQAGAKAVDESDCADVQGNPVSIGGTRAVGLQTLCDHPQEDAQHHIQYSTVALHEVTQPFGHRKLTAGSMHEHQIRVNPGGHLLERIARCPFGDFLKVRFRIR